jgi:hypothetical protein
MRLAVGDMVQLPEVPLDFVRAALWTPALRQARPQYSTPSVQRHFQPNIGVRIAAIAWLQHPICWRARCANWCAWLYCKLPVLQQKGTTFFTSGSDMP